MSAIFDSVTTFFWETWKAGTLVAGIVSDHTGMQHMLPCPGRFKCISMMYIAFKQEEESLQGWKMHKLKTIVDLPWHWFIFLTIDKIPNEKYTKAFKFEKLLNKCNAFFQQLQQQPQWQLQLSLQHQQLDKEWKYDIKRCWFYASSLDFNFLWTLDRQWARKVLQLYFSVFVSHAVGKPPNL